MTMDFFAVQNDARRRSGILMVVCLVGIVATVALTALFILQCIQLVIDWRTDEPEAVFTVLDHPGLLWVAAGVSLFILVAMLLKHASLRSGGRVVAEMMGGRLVTAATADLRERRLLNVVEEMAIASGLSVPPVYILPEEGLNAFTAGRSGHDQPDVVIAVTKGALDIFDRDELQAVIAHEFSHILHNDVGINMRFIALVFGITALTEAGSLIMSLIRHVSLARLGSRTAGPLFLLVVLAVGCMIIGYVGNFFGSITRAMICRQREYLADAASVQFTRNPKGLSTALQKIGGWYQHSRLSSPRSAEIAHMFFADYRHDRLLAALFATHPALERRIGRIDPGWSGKYPVIKAKERQKTAPELWEGKAFQAMKGPDMQMAWGALAAEVSRQRLTGAKPRIPVQKAQEAIDQTGSPTRDHLEYARAVLDRIPRPILEAAREPFGARVIIYCLLINPARDEAEARRVMLKRLEMNPSPGLLQLTEKLLPLFEDIPAQARLPLLELCTPALKMMTSDQYQNFYSTVQALIAADSRVDLFEWVVHAYVRHHIGESFRAVRPRKSTKPGKNDLAEVLGALASRGHQGDDAIRAYRAGVARLGVALPEVQSARAFNGEALSQALLTLAALPMHGKRKLIQACLACIEYDGHVTVEETELLRAISDILGCPMPPVLADIPGQTA